MPLFGSSAYQHRTGVFHGRKGVPKRVRAARARKGHKRRASHLFSGTGATRGKTTYRSRGRIL